MKTLSLDIETFSDVNLNKTGVYAYACSPNFEILLLSYSVDGGKVEVVDLARGEKLPEEIADAIKSRDVIKWAFNAQFERVCLSKYFMQWLQPESWRCSMIWAATLGLPLSLAGVGGVLGLRDQKMEEGKDLIKTFCIAKERTLPEEDLINWELFKTYNKRDVEVELAIEKKLAKFPVPDDIWKEYFLDQRINDRGILIDEQLADNAVAIDKAFNAKVLVRGKELTGLENPNSVVQLKDWLKEQGTETDSLDKAGITKLLLTATGKVKEMLKLRQKMAKSSVKKYTAMKECLCSDKRVRGLFQFYGANRTGRFSGRNIQTQNLPQNHLPDLAEARALVRRGNSEALEMLYPSVPQVLSELIRTAFIPKEGCKFFVSDFSAIEARVIAWLAGETWRLKVFEEGGDIYCMSASQMFKVPVVKHGINGELRQKGKIAELACIAEGQMVLTDKGLVPIEKVSLKHKLWDGENWVSHGGVIYKGERNVITYESLTATPDHLVWVEGEPEPMEFGKAAILGAHIVQTGNGRKMLRMGKNNICGKKMEQKMESLLCSNTMHGLRKYPVAGTQQFANRKIKRLSAMFTATKDTILVRTEAHCGKTEVRKSKRQSVSQLRRQGNKIYVSKCNRSRTVFNKEIWNYKTQFGIGQNRQQRELCSWKYQIRKQNGKLCKQENYCIIKIFTELLAICRNCCKNETLERHEQRKNYRRCETGCYQQKKKMEAHKCKVRVYDIRNAGKHHRFTVSGKLVHNCGYGGSTGALKAMGALDMGVKEEELQPLVNSWRDSNPRIVKLWWDVDKCTIDAIRGKKKVELGNLAFEYKSKMLFITLPSGRRLAYVKPKLEPNQFGKEAVTYEGIGVGKKWMRLETYGPKLVENIVQATARDLLVYAMQSLEDVGYEIVMHVHDEVIVEAPPTAELETICALMADGPKWAEGLKLNADGYVCDFYKKE